MKTREEYNAYMRAYMKERYHRLREEAKTALGGRCISCGSRENLEIDHVERKKKTVDLGVITSVAEIAWRSELEKCQLLCHECHIEKSKEYHDFQPAPRHGTIWMYQKYKCRCVECVGAASQYRRAYRARVRAAKIQNT